MGKSIIRLYHNKDWLNKAYIDKQMSTSNIGKVCGVDSKTIWAWLKKFSIPIRKRYIKKKKVELICKGCNGKFLVDKHDEFRRKYCSRDCFLKYYHHKKIKNKLIDKKFYVNTNGYICKVGSKGNGYHREIIENIIGRKLNKNECVHHINLDKKDNSIENLILLTKSQHHKLHGQLNSIVSILIKQGLISLNINTEKYELVKKEVNING